MARRRRGVIITLSSVNAEVVRPESAAYGASKGGVRQLTKAMGIALAPYGIRVNAIGPGTVVTGLARHLLRKKAWRNAVFARTPMQRVADPMEIAEVAVFLASDASSLYDWQHGVRGRRPTRAERPDATEEKAVRAERRPSCRRHERGKARAEMNGAVAGREEPLEQVVVQ